MRGPGVPRAPVDLRILQEGRVRRVRLALPTSDDVSFSAMSDVPQSLGTGGVHDVRTGSGCIVSAVHAYCNTASNQIFRQLEGTNGDPKTFGNNPAYHACIFQTWQ